MNKKLKTIKHSIQDNKFKYNIIKAQLKKGTYISKKIHPIKEVENYKNKLIESRILKSLNLDYYVLKKTIRIGGLMAYNLYAGELKDEFEINYPIVLNYDKIEKEFKIKNIYSIDNIFYNNLNIDAFRLEKISNIYMNFDFINEHNPNKFMPVEETIKNQLIKFNYITSKARHGLVKDKECDIVDEESEIQIEVVTEFKNRLKKDKSPQNNIDMMIIEYVNNNLIKPSDALLKKFIKKDYNDKYEKHLAIFCIGNIETVNTMLKKLAEELKEQVIKNDFKKKYILFYDLVLEKYYWYPDDNDNVILVNDVKEKIIYKKEINYSDMINEEKYFLECKNIFTSDVIIVCLKKNEIEDFVNKMRILDSNKIN